MAATGDLIRRHHVRFVPGSKAGRAAHISFAVAAVAWCTAPNPCGATTTPEIEPNNTKATATRVLNMASNDALSGYSFNGGDFDNFRIQTAPAPLGIYRHRLTTFGNPSVPTTALMGLQ